MSKQKVENFVLKIKNLIISLCEQISSRNFARQQKRKTKNSTVNKNARFNENDKAKMKKMHDSMKTKNQKRKINTLLDICEVDEA